MSSTGDGPLPDVLARLAHDTAPAPTPVATSPITRVMGRVICTLIFVMVILVGTGQLL